MLTKPELDRLKQYIQHAREDQTVDLKAKLSLKSDRDKESFATDICALANTGNQRAYLIIGVNDRRSRNRGRPAVPGLEIPGDDAPSEEAFEQQITEAAENHCEEPPELSVEFIDIEGKKVIIISISAINRPYILRSSPGEVRIRRGSQNKKATVREILTMQKEFMNIDVGIQLSEEIVTKSEKYHGNKDLMSVLHEVLSNTLDRVRASRREQHRYNYLMARLYWLANDTTDIPRCKKFVERALRDQDANPAYWFFKAEVCCRLAEDYIARHQQLKFFYENEAEEDQLQNHIPTELEDARKEIDEASDALETAHDFGGSMNDYIDLSEKLERLRTSFALEVESYSIENTADE